MNSHVIDVHRLSLIAVLERAALEIQQRGYRAGVRREQRVSFPDGALSLNGAIRVALGYTEKTPAIKMNPRERCLFVDSFYVLDYISQHDRTPGWAQNSQEAQDLLRGAVQALENAYREAKGDAALAVPEAQELRNVRAES